MKKEFITNAKINENEFTLVDVIFDSNPAIVNGKVENIPDCTVLDQNGNPVNKEEEFFARCTYMKGFKVITETVKFESRDQGNKFFISLKKRFNEMERVS